MSPRRIEPAAAALAATRTVAELARRLIETEKAAGDRDTTGASAAALAGDVMYHAVSRWVGSEGCHALFTRAAAELMATLPPLSTIQFRARGEPYIERVEESVARHGEAATAEAIEVLLVGVIGLLGRLIGVDLATTLIERSLLTSRLAARSQTGGERKRANG